MALPHRIDAFPNLAKALILPDAGGNGGDEGGRRRRRR
jgi:hypothetical protein